MTVNYAMKPLKLTPVVPLGRISKSKSKAKRPSFRQRKTKPLSQERNPLQLQPQHPRRSVRNDPTCKLPAHTAAPATPIPVLAQQHQFTKASAVPKPSSKPNPKVKPKPKSKPKTHLKPQPPRQHQSRLVQPIGNVRGPTRPGSLQGGFYGALPGPLPKRQQKKRQKSRKASGACKAAVGPKDCCKNVNVNVNVGKKTQSFVVDGYVFGESLGKGTFGKVDKAEHVMTGVAVAMKILDKSRITEIADVNRVTREIKILKRVRHGNVVRLFNVIDTLGHICLVTEYLDGGELFDYIVKKKRIAEPEACDLFLQIINGLDYIHSNNIIHRDLKPENLLLKIRPDGKRIVKLADFGLSNTNEGGRKLSTACGSPCYASPEMITGKRYDGTKSDIWSIGVVLYAMLCGYLPFEDDDTSLLYDKILSANYEVPRFLSPNAINLLAVILTVDPEKRYDTKAIRKHQWCVAYKGETAFTLEPNDHDTTPNESILTKLQEYGVDQVKLRESLASNKHDAYTAAYYLMLAKYGQGHACENTSEATTPSHAITDTDSSDTLEGSPRSVVPQLFPGVLIKQLDKASKASATGSSQMSTGEARQQESPEAPQVREVPVVENAAAA